MDSRSFEERSKKDHALNIELFQDNPRKFITQLVQDTEDVLRVGENAEKCMIYMVQVLVMSEEDFRVGSDQYSKKEIDDLKEYIMNKLLEYSKESKDFKEMLLNRLIKYDGNKTPGEFRIEFVMPRIIQYLFNRVLKEESQDEL